MTTITKLEKGVMKAMMRTKLMVYLQTKDTSIARLQISTPLVHHYVCFKLLRLRTAEVFSEIFVGC